jgi:hypothetical protein
MTESTKSGAWSGAGCAAWSARFQKAGRDFRLILAYRPRPAPRLFPGFSGARTGRLGDLLALAGKAQARVAGTKRVME